MKYKLYYLFIFLFSIALLSCSKRLDNTYFTVASVINGNTIKLKNGIVVRLSGISDTESSFQYIMNNLLNKKVKIVFNRGEKIPPMKSTEMVCGYLVDEERICINSQILIRKLSDLNTEYLGDSLEVYSKYASNSYTPAAASYKSESDKIDSNEKKDIRTIVRQSESSIFVVYSINENGEIFSQGTGFFIMNDNIAMSNYHVFENGSSWMIKTLDQQTYKVGDIIKASKESDFVLFKVESSHKMNPLPISNRIPERGEDIIVIGNPRGLESTVTRGVVSAFRSIVYQNDVIQIDAAISPGSSGSPVINMYGEVIGIATMKIQDCENCNFAFSINVIK